MTGTVLRIERFTIHDGPGIRTTVFLKGCPLHCAWCHSPESQSPRPEFLPPPDRCIACGLCEEACPQHAIAAPGLPTHMDLCRACGTCVSVCPTGARLLVGNEMTVDALLGEIERDRVFYDESGGGVTISGGEPLMQPEFVRAVVDQCRARDVHVAVDTSGFGSPDALDLLQPDLFLFDVKAVNEDLHRAITGVSNRVILENLARLAKRCSPGGPRLKPGACELIARFPLVPGINDTDENVHDIGRLVASLRIGHIDVLPYHRAGIAKYERLGRPYPLPDVEPPTREEVLRVAATLASYRLEVGLPPA